MKTQHKRSSFNTFAQRVLSFDKPDEAEVDELVGHLSFDFVVDSSQKARSTLLCNEKVVLEQEHSVFDMNPENSNLLVLNAAKNNYSLVVDSLDRLDVSAKTKDEVSFKSALHELNKAVSEVYFDLASFGENFTAPIFSEWGLRVNLPQIIEFAIICEQEIALNIEIVKALPTLLFDDGFVDSPRNIRALQKTLSYYATLDSTVLSKVLEVGLPDSHKGQDAYISLCISVCQNENDFSIFFQKHPLNCLSFDEFDYSRIVESFNRSPIKLNYILNTWLYECVFDSMNLAVKSHTELCFRALYFIEDNPETLEGFIDKIDVLKSVFKLNERDFNILYRDVRRSEKVILTTEEAYCLIENIQPEAFSLNNWVYFFTILSHLLSESEKLAFYEEVLIIIGIPTINSQESLTLAASIGLKQLTNTVINDSLIAYGVRPSLPMTKDYNLTDIFDCVIGTCDAPKPLSNNDQGEISVVLTTFNPNVELLKKSLLSIVGQDYKNIEIIVVDDCSDLIISEEIEKLCKCFTDVDVLYIRNSVNVGQYISRNTAIERSRGKYIAIQDDDDVSHPQRFSSQLKEMGLNNAVASFTNHVRYTDDGQLSVDNPRELLVFGDGPASLLFNKSIIDSVGGFRNYRSRGDIDFRTRVEKILGNRAIVYVGAPLYIMRSSLKTISSMYEYRNGDQLDYFRNRILLLSKIKSKGTGQVNG